MSVGLAVLRLCAVLCACMGLLVGCHVSIEEEKPSQKMTGTDHAVAGSGGIRDTRDVDAGNPSEEETAVQPDAQPKAAKEEKPATPVAKTPGAMAPAQNAKPADPMTEPAGKRSDESAGQSAPAPSQPVTLAAAELSTWSLLPDVQKYQVTGRAAPGATVTLYALKSGCQGDALGQDEADDKGFVGVVIAEIPASRGFSAQVSAAGAMRCDDFPGFFDKVEPWPPIEPATTELPSTPIINESSPYTGLNDSSPLLRGKSVAGKLSLFLIKPCEGVPEVTFDVEYGDWHHELGVFAGENQIYAQTEVDGKKSECSAPFRYVYDPANVVAVNIDSVERNSRDFHTLTVKGTSSTYTVVTAFEGADCTGRELGTGGSESQGDGSYTLELDVPEDMKALSFSVLAQRRLTGESVCRRYTGDFDLTALKPIELTVSQTLNANNLVAVTAQLSPNGYAYVSSTLYRTASCHLSVAESTEPSWTSTFTLDNFDDPDLSVLLTDDTGRTFCQPFPRVLAWPEDENQIVPALHSQIPDPSGQGQFTALLSYNQPNGSPLSGGGGVDTRDYRINLSFTEDCARPVNARPIDANSGSHVTYPWPDREHIYGYSIHITGQTLTRSKCARLK